MRSYEDTLSSELEVDLGESSSDYLAVNELPIESYDRDNWPQMVDWLHEKLRHYRRVLTNTCQANRTRTDDYESIDNDYVWPSVEPERAVLAEAGIDIEVAPDVSEETLASMRRASTAS